jgi:hypothetical protein
MRKTFWYILGGQLATISIPVMAQDIPETTAPPPADVQPAEAMMTPEQMAVVDGWPEERQVRFRQWPGDVQAYFWTLAPERQELFWRMADGDKLALVAMDEAGREASWGQIETQVGGMETGEPVADPDPIEESEPMDEAHSEHDEPMKRS